MPRVAPLDPASYRRHAIHGEDRVWTETNCYTDVIVELLHGLGKEPRAALAFTLPADFEGDQWTFFKFAPADLEALYGFDIQELAPWRPLASHVEEQVALGRPVLVELDSFYLPDTAGTAYRLAHVKTTVAVNEIDLERGYLGYFHNQGYHAQEGADFAEVFQTAGLVHERMLPPYIEYVKRLPHHRPLSRGARLEASLASLQRHLRRMPERNPFPAFKAAFERDLDWLLQAELEVFHAYSFATLRQYGACFGLAETYLAWLQEEGVEGFEPARQAFDEISRATKAFQFALARSMARRRPLDLSPLDGMAELWERAAETLLQQAGAAR
ncbi:MAG TPA: DUF1839 family protein [Holophagaceae bacterium]|nr:DUF1839 family protein [Holophagaceae bacterium]